MAEVIRHIPIEDRLRIAAETIEGARQNSASEQDKSTLEALAQLVGILRAEDDSMPVGIWLPSGVGLDFGRPMGDYYYQVILGHDWSKNTNPPDELNSWRGSLPPRPYQLYWDD